MYKNKNVLVTGGTGLIGRPLVEALLKEGASVRVVSMDTPDRCPKGCEFMQKNLVYWDDCRDAVKDMDLVFHLVGIKASVSIGASRAATNLVSHLLFNTHMMEAARQEGVERYLYTSTIGTYAPAEIYKEEDMWNGQPHYTDKYSAWAKRIGELQAEAYKAEFGWDKIAIVRPANVYGPWDNFDPSTAMVIPALIHRALSGENPLKVWGDGSIRRDFIFSEDCARGMLLAMEKSADCDPLNLGSGTTFSIREVVEEIIKYLGLSTQVAWDTSKPTGEPVRMMDMTKAEAKLGKFNSTSLSEGIARTIDWYEENRDIAQDRFKVFKEPKYV